MAHKKKNGGSVPRGNKSNMGPTWSEQPAEKKAAKQSSRKAGAAPEPQSEKKQPVKKSIGTTPDPEFVIPAPADAGQRENDA